MMQTIEYRTGFCTLVVSRYVNIVKLQTNILLLLYEVEYYYFLTIGPLHSILFCCVCQK